MMPVNSSATQPPGLSWHERINRARSKLTSVLRNTRHIETLLWAPREISPATVASLVQTVNLVIEARCNIRCSCCHYFATRDESSLDLRWDLPRMLALLDEVPHALVAITGGEPLMSPALVVETAQALLKRKRSMALVTNCLPLADPKRGELARGILLSGISPADRAQLRVQCSVDLQHQAASRLSVEEYVARCQSACRALAAAGFPVFTRTIVTTRDEYAFFKERVLPWAESGATLGASVQPDIYDLPRFAAALRGRELGDMGARLGPAYLKRIVEEGDRGRPAIPAENSTALRTAPWVFIEVNARGVKGPSGFVAEGEHHASVLEMMRSYDWLRVADTIVPQITISRNAFPYRIDRRRHSVALHVPHLLRSVLWRRHRLA